MISKWPYLAGIVDGEGSIVIYKGSAAGSFTSEVVIPNTSLNLMKWLTDNFGGRYSVLYPKNSHGYNRKPLYRWRVSGKKNRENLILGILPYMVIKRKQAEVMLEFERLGYGEQEKRNELSKMCCQLNHGEESVTTNMSNMGTENPLKIESELTGDCESTPDVNQGSDACSLPPVGWWCSRVNGHDGPCAARPSQI